MEINFIVSYKYKLDFFLLIFIDLFTWYILKERIKYLGEKRHKSNEMNDEI